MSQFLLQLNFVFFSSQDREEGSKRKYYHAALGNALRTYKTTVEFINFSNETYRATGRPYYSYSSAHYKACRDLVKYQLELDEDVYCGPDSVRKYTRFQLNKVQNIINKVKKIEVMTTINTKRCLTTWTPLRTIVFF